MSSARTTARQDPGPGLTLKPRMGAAQVGAGTASEAAIARFIDAAVSQDGPNGGDAIEGARTKPAMEEGRGPRRKTSGHRGRKKAATEMGETERLTVTLLGTWIAEIDQIAERAGRSRNDLVREVLRRTLRLGTDPLDEILSGR